MNYNGHIGREGRDSLLRVALGHNSFNDSSMALPIRNAHSATEMRIRSQARAGGSWPQLRIAFAGAWFALVVTCVSANLAMAMDRVSFRRGNQTIELLGRVVTKAQDGGMLFLGRQGMLWAVQPDEFLARQSDERPFAPLEPDVLSNELQQEFGAEFTTYETAHYVVCHNATPEYARWCAALFERLYRAFTNDWRNRGFDVREPEFPLVAIIFRDRESYARHAREEIGDAVNSVIGYYNLQTNRITMYDLTSGVPGDLTRRLAHPALARNVATVVHEATHQIAFNCGLHTRLADIPLWVSEGIAVYCETPDLKSRRGWRGFGDVNHARLQRFHRYQRSRPDDSLITLIQDDARFRDPSEAEDAYAEAWGLTYFLLRKHEPQFIDYLTQLAAKPPIVRDSPEARVAEFKAAFGESIADLDAEFLRYMNRIR